MRRIFGNIFAAKSKISDKCSDKIYANKISQWDPTLMGGKFLRAVTKSEGCCYQPVEEHRDQLGEVRSSNLLM